MPTRILLVVLACSATHLACGARSSLAGDAAGSNGGSGAGNEAPPHGGAGREATGGDDTGGGETGGAPVVAPQCLRKNLPGYAACVLPLMCCPTVASCEDPASFNCSGSQAFFCDP